MAQSQQAKRARRALFSDLAVQFPSTFKLDAPVPLKVGIRADLAAALPEKDPRIVNAFLAWYCGRKVYLHCLAPGAPRIGLDGEPHGAVDVAHSLRAATMLSQRLGITPAQAASAA